jgi:hypothetical protein
MKPQRVGEFADLRVASHRPDGETIVVTCCTEEIPHEGSAQLLSNFRGQGGRTGSDGAGGSGLVGDEVHDHVARNQLALSGASNLVRDRRRSERLTEAIGTHPSDHAVEVAPFAGWGDGMRDDQHDQEDDQAG